MSNEFEARKKLKREFFKKKSCEGKIKYLDDTSARARAERDKKEHSKRHLKGRPDGHRAYSCIFCGFWHVGTFTNPNFREDFYEVVDKGYGIHIKFFKQGEKADSLYQEGLIKKEELKDGAYYLGWSRHAKVARWHAEENLFFYFKKTNDEETEEGVPYLLEAGSHFFFVPVSETRPTARQLVYAAFGESPPAKRLRPRSRDRR